MGRGIVIERTEEEGLIERGNKMFKVNYQLSDRKLKHLFHL